MRSPFDISYNDLVTYVENKLRWQEQNIVTMKLKGHSPGYRAEKELETAKTLLRLLRKHQHNPQGDLFQMFENLK
jgi:hypothetical protein